MVKEAEAHASEDQARRALVEVRNQADVLLHSAEKNLKEFGEAVSADERQQIENDAEALRSAKDGDDLAAIQSKIEALSTSSMKLGEAMYKAQAEGQADDTATSEEAADSGNGGADTSEAEEPASTDDDVVDADFEEVDEDKKNKSA